MDGSAIAVQIITKLVYAAIGGILLWPFRYFKKKIEEFTAALKDLQNELTVQRTNCLTTLQDQGERQVELLKDVSESLKDMSQSQAEINGWLKGRL